MKHHCLHLSMTILLLRVDWPSLPNCITEWLDPSKKTHIITPHHVKYSSAQNHPPQITRVFFGKGLQRWQQLDLNPSRLAERCLPCPWNYTAWQVAPSPLSSFLINETLKYSNKRIKLFKLSWGMHIFWRWQPSTASSKGEILLALVTLDLNLGRLAERHLPCPWSYTAFTVLKNKLKRPPKTWRHCIKNKLINPPVTMRLYVKE